MSKPPNTSHAVRSQRHIATKGRDDFPTPPWATRALFELLTTVTDTLQLRKQTVLEPATGRGHMARVLQGYFKRVVEFDKYRYPRTNYDLQDFLQYNPRHSADWLITNPPFNQALEFILHAFAMTPNIAILARLQLLESIKRYNELFKDNPPQIVAPFVERVVLHKGKLSAKGSTATCYAWFVWLDNGEPDTQVRWIPPCRKRLEHKADYR